MECFVHEFPSLRNKILYKFEPAVGDKVKGISKDHGADLHLNKQARYWAQELTKHQQAMVEKSKAIKGLQSVTQAYQMVGGGVEVSCVGVNNLPSSFSFTFSSSFDLLRLQSLGHQTPEQRPSRV